MSEPIRFQFDPSPERTDRMLSARPGEHCFITTVVYRMTGESLREYTTPGGVILLDMENVATAASGCYTCEQPFTPRLSYRKCTGEP